jgi:radical SAM protein with 4Fe4S-binding SPASM domain
MKVNLSDCLGYYNIKETEIRSSYLPEGYDDCQFSINGCKAGLLSMGIMANGNVTGCISLQDKGYIEGNVRERSLLDIWNDPNSFSWNKNLKKENLKGFCHKCQYGNYCHSGCPASSRNINDNRQFIENEYCSYNVLAKKETQKMYSITNLNVVIKKAEKAFIDEDYQLAEIYFDYINKKIPGNSETKKKLNIIEEKLDNRHLILNK